MIRSESLFNTKDYVLLGNISIETPLSYMYNIYKLSFINSESLN